MNSEHNFTEAEIENAEKVMILEYIRESLDCGAHLDTILENIALGFHRA